MPAQGLAMQGLYRKKRLAGCSAACARIQQNPRDLGIFRRMQGRQAMAGKRPCIRPFMEQPLRLGGGCGVEQGRQFR